MCVRKNDHRSHEATDKQVCDLAAGFWDELQAIHRQDDLQSSRFLGQLSHLRRTGHENRVEQVFEQYTLQAPIPVTEVRLNGLSQPHPVLRIQDVLETLSSHDKMDCLLHGHRDTDFLRFWECYRHTDPHHEVYKVHRERLEHCIPYMLHSDEGTGMKKKAVLICQIHPLLGLGSRRGEQLNYLGSTFLTRLLYTTMPAKYYKKKKKVILTSLFQHWSDDMLEMFETGAVVKIQKTRQRIFMVPLACKGDWPALIQMGQLNRHFGHVAKKGGRQINGICHLCSAGMDGFDWHDFGANASWHLNQEEIPKPWNERRPSPLLRLAMTQSPQRLGSKSMYSIHVTKGASRISQLRL